MAKARPHRADNIRKMLEQRKRQLTAELQGLMRDVRREGRRERGADEHDVAEADTRSDIDLAVIQLKSETVARIDAALKRLEKGDHGDCVECGEKISMERLTALPFALRCRDCEESREKSMSSARARAGGGWRDSMASFD
jgi:DnaK suppressor protein